MAEPTTTNKATNEESEIKKIKNLQTDYFQQGHTKPIPFRRGQLERLKHAIAQNEQEILSALKEDLGKPAFEAFASEIGFLYDEIKFVQKHLDRWAQPQKVPTPMTHFPAKSFIQYEPKGLTLIIAPWNYPFQLLISPLIGAIAAGNCAVLKPSELAPKTAELIAKVVEQTFDKSYIACVLGGIETNQQLLQEAWDHIFFTGSTAVGKIVMQAAAKHLTPVTLELGGKSPSLVEASAPLEVTARRLVWGKFFNAGQTCVAPDYLLVPKAIKTPLIGEMQKCLKAFFGDNPAESTSYGRIISDRHFQRLSALIQSGKIIHGGEMDAPKRYLAPTLIDEVEWKSPIMQEEIFGPLFPILEYEHLDDAIDQIKQQPKPLAFYFFSADTKLQKKVLEAIPFGGGCLNDTLVHLSNPHLPFGGTGPSGLGAYHGKYSFETFSHAKSILDKSLSLDIKLRYSPYTPKKLQWLKRLLRP